MLTKIPLISDDELLSKGEPMIPTPIFGFKAYFSERLYLYPAKRKTENVFKFADL